MAVKRQLVVFRVGAEEFAVDILLTKEVVSMCDITPVPETQDYVEGVMNLRGNLVPVVDLRKRLRARTKAGHEERRIIIANCEERLTGLIVDGASEVIRVSEEMIEPPPDLISEIGADYVEGVINLDSRFITLIDLKNVLTEDVNCELDQVLEILVGSGRQDSTPAQVG
ncbi:MAG TPA: chemotaxis protein CheW [Blastocatellia bacterium]|jgi:purine-binding chemotaxis protein CheW|nr:chemotaxis protein CheW [Blastocatellia bacterium]